MSRVKHGSIPRLLGQQARAQPTDLPGVLRGIGCACVCEGMVRGAFANVCFERLCFREGEISPKGFTMNFQSSIAK